MATGTTSAVDLWWLPLGAGGHSVRLNGRVFQAVASRMSGRPACDLYHSALIVRTDGVSHAIEMTPVARGDGAGRGVVSGGAVGARAAGRMRMFRYEVRCWRDGVIPDLAEAVGGPRRLSGDTAVAGRVLTLVPSVPTPVWGRDELRTGEMWNSNSLTSWLIARAGLDIDAIHPPAGGRAPGWAAGIAVAHRAQPPGPPAPYLR